MWNGALCDITKGRVTELHGSTHTVCKVGGLLSLLFRSFKKNKKLLIAVDSNEANLSSRMSMRRTYLNDHVARRISGHSGEIAHQIFKPRPTVGINHPTCRPTKQSFSKKKSNSRSSNTPPHRLPDQPLTLDHDHVDVDGADGRLRKSLPSLQHVRDLSGGNHVVGLRAKGHQLPHSHSCEGGGQQFDKWINL